MGLGPEVDDGTWFLYFLPMDYTTNTSVVIPRLDRRSDDLRETLFSIYFDPPRTAKLSHSLVNRAAVAKAPVQ